MNNMESIWIQIKFCRCGGIAELRTPNPFKSCYCQITAMTVMQNTVCRFRAKPLTHSLPRGPKIKIQEKSQITFCKMLKKQKW